MEQVSGKLCFLFLLFREETVIDWTDYCVKRDNIVTQFYLTEMASWSTLNALLWEVSIDGGVTAYSFWIFELLFWVLENINFVVAHLWGLFPMTFLWNIQDTMRTLIGTKPFIITMETNKSMIS